ncbi:MAG TPA: gliding motility-associated C-terminal domain-containing protein, partial [Chitinophagaceae bacterium]|nr:gliding motility-associated C-terminal domain-containing protein [Chitinophagaceae bacterium]
VRTAGTYSCTVTDSCGNQKTDELTVNYHTPWTLTAGSPITKCAADTVLLPTTPGLHSISWYPANQVINMPAGLPGAIASTTTDYILTGKDQFECPVKDHWLLSIWPTPVISLGADTTICPEGSAVLVAPVGFSSYLWSTGLLSRQINTSMPGKYWVFATDDHGCHASDSIQVKTFTSPLPKIIGNTWICRGQPTELNAGNFSSYLWQDGSQQQFLTVSDTGYYHVSVTDTHHCSAVADLHIATVQELPAHFLPPDTSVCAGFFTVISALRSYNKYVWSTGETGASIKVSQAGRYQLKVMNEKGCVGVDSCLVVSKDCEAKIWFPNAFTPNGDGNNDIFRLKFPGHAANYHLEIFNRWGQRIFNSNDPSAGWNGDTSGQKQPAGVYIWMVHWSSLDGVAQQKKGSVVLIR